MVQVILSFLLNYKNLGPLREPQINRCKIIDDNIFISCGTIRYLMTEYTATLVTHTGVDRFMYSQINCCYDLCKLFTLFNKVIFAKL